LILGNRYKGTTTRCSQELEMAPPTVLAEYLLPTQEVDRITKHLQFTSK